MLIAFSYGGDLWSVSSVGGEARRLTVSESYEHTPVWSPNGEWIAFSGDESGDDDVYIIPSQGGNIRRITSLDVDDQICGWSADGQSVVFSSRRDDRYPDMQLIYQVSIDGGEPIRLIEAYGAEASINPDGERVLFTRNDGQWWRKGYLSSGSPEVWLANLKSGAYEAISDTLTPKTGSEFKAAAVRWPLWGADNSIYVTAEWGGTFNIWQRSSGKGWKQVTSFKDDGVRFPSIARNGKLITFEQGTDIWTLAPGGMPTRLEIIAPLAIEEEDFERISFSDKADRVAFTSDGKQMLLELRGEVAASRIVGDDDKAARGRANLLSQNNWARDGDFSLSPGGDSAVVVSDRAGSRDLYLVYSDDPETKELSRALRVKWEAIVSSPEEDYSPDWSPDGKSIAFTRGMGNLIIYDLEKKSERQLLTGWSLLQYEWSPDSKWMAFAREDDEYNSEIFIIPAAGGPEVNVSMHPDEDEYPVWSGDGKKLGFRSRRRENNWDIYVVQLKLADYQKSAADRAEEIRLKAAEKKASKDDDKDKKKDDKKDDKEKKEEKVVVVIDTTDIYKRVQPVTQLAGEEGIFTISPDGEKFAFVANHEGEKDVYVIKWTGESQKRLTNGGADPKYLDFESSGKRVRYLDGGGRVKSVETDGGSSKDHAFDARIVVNRRSERAQKFDEVWRRLNIEFYDANFHGHDWKALGAKYRPWAMLATTEDDFGDVVKMMMGELNASHMGYYSPQGTSRRVTGCLGLDFDRAADGAGLLVSHVVKRGPCDKEVSRVQVGDRLISVAGVKVNEKISLEELLEDQVGQRVELIVQRGKKNERIIIRPIHRNELADLRYDEWVDERSARVESLSGGRFGYLHIRGMGEGSLARFEAELYSVGRGKEGLVVDVRYNGGGWTTDWLLAMLQVKRHAITFPRGGGPGYPQGRLPLYSWTKPIVTICNEHSFSNAEIFSHAVKTLGRGKLVGVPTPGGVISTGGDGLVDGSGYRIPLRGWYVGSDTTFNPARNMEGNGAVPDVIVPLLPGEVSVGDDRQLQEAVSQLLKDLGAGKN